MCDSMEVDVEGFVNRAIAHKAPTLFKNVPEDKHTLFFQDLHTNMKKDGGLDNAALAAKYQLTANEMKAVDRLQSDISCAMDCLGMDMDDDDAVDRIIWSV